jgi:hypothetical protein
MAQNIRLVRHQGLVITSAIVLLSAAVAATFLYFHARRSEAMDRQPITITQAECLRSDVTLGAIGVQLFAAHRRPR